MIPQLSLLRACLKALLTSSILIAPLYYSFLNASMHNASGDTMVVLIFVFSLGTFFLSKQFEISRQVIGFYSIYTVIALISLSYSDYASLKWFLNSNFRFGLLIIGLFAFFQIEKFDIRILIKIIPFAYILLLILSIGVQKGILNKDYLDFLTPADIASFGWNNKFLASMLSVAVWLVVCCLRWCHERWKIFALVIILLNAYTLWGLGSFGAKLATLVGVVVFCSTFLINFKKRFGIYLIGSLVSIMLAVTLVFFYWAKPMPTYGDFVRASSVKNSVQVRGYIYSHVATLIKERPIIGYGFGSTKILPYSGAKYLQEGWGERLPGGHPHNMVYLFWLEHGFVGIVFLITINVMFLLHLRNNSEIGAEVFCLPMLMAYQTIISFSFDIWAPDIILFNILAIFYMKLIIEICTEHYEVNS